MIDEYNKLNNSENSKTVLKGKKITSMTEDEKGNLFFVLWKMIIQNQIFRIH
jgi:hypothetical protein